MISLTCFSMLALTFMALLLRVVHLQFLQLDALQTGEYASDQVARAADTLAPQHPCIAILCHMRIHKYYSLRSPTRSCRNYQRRELGRY